MKKLLIVALLLASVNAFCQETATVNLIRRKMYNGAYGPFKFFIDGELVCRVNNNSYSTHKLAPGEHSFSVQAGGNELKKGAADEAIKITVESGKVYYVIAWLERKGLISNLLCEEITESTWKRYEADLKKDNCL